MDPTPSPLPLARSTPFPVALAAAAALLFGGGPAAAQVAALDAAQSVEPVRLTSEVLGEEAAIEVRNLPGDEARTAIRGALLEMFEVGVLLDPDAPADGGLGALNRAAGVEARELDPRVFELLVRSLQYCFWSHGAHGPLGGSVYRLWRQKDEMGRSVEPLDLREAVATAQCSQLTLQPGEPPMGSLGAGSGLLAFGMARGFLVDLAVAHLEERGATNLVVELGTVVRAVGPGPTGSGWAVAIPGTREVRHPLDQIWLRDQSLVVIRRPAPGTGVAIPIDQRTGVPARGVVQVAAVSRLAVDTEAMSTALFVLGLTEGQRHLGSLDPRPSVFWLLGSSGGVPLESTYRWSELARIR